MFRPMKPETLARRTQERVAKRAANKADRIARLKELIERDGIRSVWSDLLALEEGRQAEPAPGPVSWIVVDTTLPTSNNIVRRCSSEADAVAWIGARIGNGKTKADRGDYHIDGPLTEGMF